MCAEKANEGEIQGNNTAYPSPLFLFLLLTLYAIPLLILFFSILPSESFVNDTTQCCPLTFGGVKYSNYTVHVWNSCM